jgi:3-deoxy-7-phosphoheptulonate synthase
MVVVMETDAPEGAIEAVVSYLVGAGADVHRSSGQTRTILGVVGDISATDAAVVAEMRCVTKVVRVTEPYKLASRRFRQQSSIVDGAWGAIGADRPWIAVEAVGYPHDGDVSERQSLPYAVAAGGPFDAAVTRSAEGPDGVGALSCLSVHPQPIASRFPVLFVTREPSQGLDQWIEDAEKELTRGGDQVVLLEAGSIGVDGTRSLEVTNLTRARAATHLPVVVDVPRIAGRRQHCAPVAYAAVAAGASGVILRAWFGPPEKQPRIPATLLWDEASAVANRLRAIGEAVRA